MTSHQIILRKENGVTILLDVVAMSIVYENEGLNTRKVYRLDDTGKGVKIELFGTTKLSGFPNRKKDK